MARVRSRVGRIAFAFLVLATMGLAIGYGVAQSTLVTQAEWSVYVAQGLGLDWNLPPNAKSNHYMARLEWSKSIDFQASQMLEGSTAQLQADGSVQGNPIVPSEALYEVATLRAGDYGFRVKLGGGEAVLKVADRTYELFQPEVQPRWVDLDRVPLSPGPHRMSLMLAGGAQATSLGIIPPCMLPVEPSGGWKPLEPLRFDEMAVSLASALDLEQNLPKIGDPITIRGEDFTRTLTFPYEGEDSEGGVDDPFWLSSGGSIVTAVARFTVPEKGVYSIEARYISARPIRWNMDRCLRVVTCPVVPSQIGRRRSMALEFEAGEHELEVTLPPGAKLDRVDVQHRDGSAEEYVRVVEDEGFKLGDAADNVRRRDALRAARRLQDRFQRMASLRCEDSLIAMEAAASALALQASNNEMKPMEGSGGNVPAATAGVTQTTFSDPLVPAIDEDSRNPDVASPGVKPILS